MAQAVDAPGHKQRKVRVAAHDVAPCPRQPHAARQLREAKKHTQRDARPIERQSREHRVRTATMRGPSQGRFGEVPRVRAVRCGERRARLPGGEHERHDGRYGEARCEREARRILAQMRRYHEQADGVGRQEACSTQMQSRPAPRSAQCRGREGPQRALRAYTLGAHPMPCERACVSRRACWQASPRWPRSARGGKGGGWSQWVSHRGDCACRAAPAMDTANGHRSPVSSMPRPPASMFSSGSSCMRPCTGTARVRRRTGTPARAAP